MGAGLSKRQLYGRQYRLLQRHMETLRQAGFTDLMYKNLAVYGRRQDGGPLDCFRLSYSISRASNGEVAGFLTCNTNDSQLSENVINIIRKGGK